MSWGKMRPVLAALVLGGAWGLWAGVLAWGAEVRAPAGSEGTNPKFWGRRGPTCTHTAREGLHASSMARPRLSRRWRNPGRHNLCFH